MSTEQYSGPRRNTKEGMLPKARRLVAEGAVEQLANDTFIVYGTQTNHKLAFGKEDLHCSCKAGGFGNGCSHRLAVELFLSGQRRAS